MIYTAGLATGAELPPLEMHGLMFWAVDSLFMSPDS